MKKLVRTRFPSVPQTSTQELATWMNDRRTPQPLLLDVRTKAEFEVSHLPGARRVDPDAKAADVLPLLDGNRPVVAYCSVGCRSSELVDRLRKAGVSQASNLEGSIFQWANATFGKMLDEQRRADGRD